MDVLSFVPFILPVLMASSSPPNSFIISLAMNSVMMAACQPFLSGAISKTVNLPETATIRIFSLSGQLVRTLHKTDPTSSMLDWDLQNENQLPVASGVYVYHVEAPGAGESIGRLVVFMEKERLNNF